MQLEDSEDSGEEEVVPGDMAGAEIPEKRE